MLIYLELQKTTRNTMARVKLVLKNIKGLRGKQYIWVDDVDPNKNSYNF